MRLWIPALETVPSMIHWKPSHSTGILMLSFSWYVMVLLLFYYCLVFKGSFQHLLEFPWQLPGNWNSERDIPLPMWDKDRLPPCSYCLPFAIPIHRFPYWFQLWFARKVYRPHQMHGNHCRYISYNAGEDLWFPWSLVACVSSWQYSVLVFKKRKPPALKRGVPLP